MNSNNDAPQSAESDSMATKRRFEIRPAAGGYEVFARTSGDFSSVGGLARMDIYKTEAEAKVWVGEQFAIQMDAWRRVGNNLVATKE